MKSNIKIICLIFLSIITSPMVLAAQNYDGYYVEYINKNKRNKSISSAEFLMNEEELREFITNYDIGFFAKPTYTRFFNYSSFYFANVPKKLWANGCLNLNCIDWNFKISLHRSNYDSCHKLFRLKKELKKNEGAFHIKKVMLDIDSLGTIKTLRMKKINLEFMAVGGSTIYNKSDNNVLLRKIYQQEVLSEKDINALGLNNYLEFVDKVKANNEFHPYFSDSHTISEKLDTAKFNCLCEFNYFRSH